MTSTRERYEIMRRLQDLGISYEDANRLRRISLTLQRWFELECGDGNDYGSWAIERDEDTYRDWECHCGYKFSHRVELADHTTNLSGEKTVYCPKCGKRPLIGSPHRGGDGKPYMVHHHYLHGHGKDYTTRTRIPDREMGARKRLGKMMEKYPQLAYYIQTDPRGCALYILKYDDVKGQEIDQVYNRGVAVY